MSCAPLLLLGCLALSGLARIGGIEPGKDKQDFDTIEEVESHYDSLPTEAEPEDVSWVPEAVLDVAYYLRKFKNNGYDPRYLTEGVSPRRDLYRQFPNPPLENLQWEVKINCESSFAECLRYLQEKVSQTELPRRLDSLTVIQHNGWTLDKDEDLIKATDAACVELRNRDEKTFHPFHGPLHKFQWLLSASYYMCRYTMREEAHLSNFRGPCDNFANCLDWSTGPSNGDVRADNERPFACAAYSFCPDPCCPERLLRAPGRCSGVNPCARHRPRDESCLLLRRENANLASLVLNHWNVTCNCDEPGMRWSSRSGMCVDVDECAENRSSCDEPAQSCMNLPGSYACVCNVMGYAESPTGNCTPDPLVLRVIRPRKAGPQCKRKTFADSFFDVVYRLKSILSVSGEAEDGEQGEGVNCSDSFEARVPPL